MVFISIRGVIFKWDHPYGMIYRDYEYVLYGMINGMIYRHIVYIYMYMYRITVYIYICEI
jgi:hypothetical protein